MTVDDDGEGSDTIDGAGEIGGIGAGGGRDKGKKIANEVKRGAEARRKAQQDRAQEIAEPPPLRDFGDGSKLIKDWSHSHPEQFSIIINQTTDICWAYVLGKILEFVYNKDRPVNQHLTLDIENFVRSVKMSDGKTKLDPNVILAVGSLNKAIDHILSEGIAKSGGRKKAQDIMHTLRGEFATLKKATPQDIIRQLDNGPVGITVDLTMELRNIQEGIYRIPKPIAGLQRHALTIVAYGRTKEGEVFFVAVNTWGIGWGVNGHGRIIITGTTDDVFYLKRVITK